MKTWQTMLWGFVKMWQTMLFPQIYRHLAIQTKHATYFKILIEAFEMVSLVLPERSRNSSLGNEEISGTFSKWLQARSRVCRWGRVGMAGREESSLEWRRRQRSRGLPMIGGKVERELLEKLTYSSRFMCEKNLYIYEKGQHQPCRSIPLRSIVMIYNSWIYAYPVGMPRIWL